MQRFDEQASADCPDVSVWTRFLAGGCSDRQLQSLSAHLHDCSGCGRILANLTSVGRRRPQAEEFQVDSRGDGGPPAQLSQALAALGSRPSTDPLQHLGDRFGPFRLIRRLGAGGFGFVYLAEDISLARQIALKVPRGGDAMSETERQRFIWEGLAAASLRHPNVVSLLEAGEHSGIPYLVSEFCSGPRLSAVMAEGPMGPSTAAGIIYRLAQAVQHAHSRGILHRDIKPSNILLDECLEEEERLGIVVAGHRFVPKLADFGLAKRIVSTSDGQAATQTDFFQGTPAYMAPEQLQGEVNALSDVFSLGVVLHEMLSGCRLFANKTPWDRVKESTSGNEVPPPSCEGNLIPRDLETICLKCLRLRADARYQNAGLLADDLGRYLRDEPILARPVGRSEKLLRWIRREPYQAALSAALLAIPLLLSLGLLIHNRRLHDAFATAVASERNIRNLLYAADVRQMFQAWDTYDSSTFESYREKYAREEAESEVRGIELAFLDRLRQPVPGEVNWRAHGEPICCLRFSPDGESLATCSSDGTIKIWDVASRKLRDTLRGHRGDVNKILFVPETPLLVSAGDDGTVRFWNVATGELERTIFAQQNRIFELCIDPRTGHLVSGGDGPGICYWDLVSGRLVQTQEGDMVRAMAPHPQMPCLGIATSVGDTPGLRLVSLVEDLPLPTFHVQDAGAISDMDFSPDGGVLAAASRLGTVRVYNVVNGELLIQLEGHIDAVRVVRFSADRFIATGSDDGTVRIWDANYRPFRAFRGHLGQIGTLCFSPDGGTLASGDNLGTVHLWKWRQHTDLSYDRLVDSLGNASPAMAEYDSRRRLVTSCQQAAFQILAAEGAAVGRWGTAADAAAVRSLRLSPDEQRVAVGTRGGDAVLWNLNASTPERTLRGHQGPVWDCEFLDEQRLITAGEDGFCRLWDLRTGEVLRSVACHDKPVMAVDVTPHRKWMVTGSVDGTVRLWSLPSLERVRVFRGHQDVVHDVAFSPDARSVASVSHDRSVRIFDVATGECVAHFRGHRARVLCLAFSPDGRTLISGDATGVMRFWQVATSEPLGAIDTGFAGIEAILVRRPDRPSITVISGTPTSGGGTAIRWDLPPRTR